MHQDIVYIMTHGEKTDERIEEHTDGGHAFLASRPITYVTDYSLVIRVSTEMAPLLKQLQLGFIWYGAGQRHEETWKAIRHDYWDRRLKIHKVPVMCSDIFGTDTSVTQENGKLLATTTSGSKLSAICQYKGLLQWKCIDPWKLLQEVALIRREVTHIKGRHSLVISGAFLVSALGFADRGTTASLFEVKPFKRSIVQIMADGIIIDRRYEGWYQKWPLKKKKRVRKEYAR